MAPSCASGGHPSQLPLRGNDLQSAFGAYVDPALAARLLQQGTNVFSGERREVTVMFVDIRDFIPFAEANTADGAMAVFGAPNDLADHADAAVRAAVLIHRLVAEQFEGGLRIGIGINTGVVIAGTIGSGPHLEFSLIGDTTNVAARVEQLTKITGDAILLTDQTVDALDIRPPGLVDRGAHALKGKSAPTAIFGLDPAATRQRLISTITEMAVVDRPEEPMDDGNGQDRRHHHQ